ncbi:MAG: single-stranded DNA-binding protein [Clostridia bacterium]|nr:single-stranded DNA-binding protein [Clostridia bacterium]
MNRAILTGRLTADPELKTTNGGKYVTEFNLAVDRFAGGEKRTDFIRCQAWDKTAESFCKWQRKGNAVAVDGWMHYEEFPGRDGNKRYRTIVVATSIEFFSSREREANDGIPNNAQQQPQQGAYRSSSPERRTNGGGNYQNPGYNAPAQQQNYYPGEDDLPF